MTWRDHSGTSVDIFQQFNLPLKEYNGGEKIILLCNK